MDCADFLVWLIVIMSLVILVEITKLYLAENAMPGSDNFQLFVGYSLLTLFMKTKSYYNYGLNAYFL